MSEARYYKIKPDGAPWRCSDCGENKPHNEVIVAHTPDGKKRLLCLDCVDEDWLSNARFAGHL